MTELFGRPTDLPWRLQIAPENRPSGHTEYATFHPTLLYESLWNLGVTVLVIWADRRFRLGHGRALRSTSRPTPQVAPGSRRYGSMRRTSC